MKAINARRFGGASRGFSLIELMVSMAIGLVVMAAVLLSYLGTGLSGRHSTAMSQMTEDASVALSLMRNHVAMAGYSNPTGFGAGGALQTRYSGRAVFGCEGVKFQTETALDLNALTTGVNCATAASGSDVFGVAYEADTSNAITKSDAGVTKPTDCLGQVLTEITGGASGNYYLADNRFYVQDDQLYCQGSGDRSNAKPLVENITNLQVTYGIGGTDTATAKQVIQYLSASEVDAAVAWDRVLSLRLCVVVRSANMVIDNATTNSYRDCSFTAVSPGDKFMYRAFTSTVVLHNRTGGV